MRSPRTKVRPPAAPVPPTVSDDELAVLTSAFKAGLILAWKRDVERGYRLTLAGPRDEYIEVAKLTGYLEKLKTAAARMPAA
jgi:hypothetical protein